MSEHVGFDLEEEASRAWKSFAGRLADHIAGMRDGDTFTIRLAGLVESEHPQLVFTTVGDDQVCCTIESPALNVRVDDSQHRRDVALVDELTALGWPLVTQVSAAQFRPDVMHARRVMARREADELSALTVRVLYDVMGALHPVFLRVIGQANLVDYSAAGADMSAKPAQPVLVTEPVDSHHLGELVRQAIAVEVGREPVHDADGDLIVETAKARVFVRVLHETPVIHIFARLVHHIGNPFEAPSAVAKLNADYSFIKFMFADDAMFAQVQLPATPFVPVQLRRMLATFVQIAEQLGDELLEPLGGEPEINGEGEGDTAADEPDGIPPELVTLLGLDPDGLGLDPELTADVCGHYRALAWQLLHIASGQEEVWRAARFETDDPEQELNCAEEAAGWKATRLSLASALELINSRTV